MPVSDLKAGAPVKGVTISDLGPAPSRLDMVPYHKDGTSSSSSRTSSFGVGQAHADTLGQYQAD